MQNFKQFVQTLVEKYDRSDRVDSYDNSYEAHTLEPNKNFVVHSGGVPINAVTNNKDCNKWFSIDLRHHKSDIDSINTIAKKHGLRTLTIDGLSREHPDVVNTSVKGDGVHKLDPFLHEVVENHPMTQIKDAKCHHYGLVTVTERGGGDFKPLDYYMVSNDESYRPYFHPTTDTYRGYPNRTQGAFVATTIHAPRHVDTHKTNHTITLRSHASDTYSANRLDSDIKSAASQSGANVTSDDGFYTISKTFDTPDAPNIKNFAKGFAEQFKDRTHVDNVTTSHSTPNIEGKDSTTVHHVALQCKDENDFDKYIEHMPKVVDHHTGKYVEGVKQANKKNAKPKATNDNQSSFEF